MKWSVELHPEFAKELADYLEGVQDRVYAEIVLLEKHGPQLQRPHADTLKDSKYSNIGVGNHSCKIWNTNKFMQTNTTFPKTMLKPLTK